MQIALLRRDIILKWIFTRPLPNSSQTQKDSLCDFCGNDHNELSQKQRGLCDEGHTIYRRVNFNRREKELKFNNEINNSTNNNNKELCIYCGKEWFRIGQHMNSNSTCRRRKRYYGWVVQRREQVRRLKGLPPRHPNRRPVNTTNNTINSYQFKLIDIPQLNNLNINTHEGASS